MLLQGTAKVDGNVVGITSTICFREVNDSAIVLSFSAVFTSSKGM